MPSAIPAFPEFLSLLREHGHTAEAYLVDHYPRFVGTLGEFQADWSQDRGRRVLDVGAHWLHQSVLFATQCFEVTALDLPATLALPDVRALAAAHRIRLIECDDLEQPHALSHLPTSGFDVILFTEIIEHITFNPVGLWREIHRIAAPGARIVVTTPNYYALRECLARPLRALRRMGGGVSVDQILQQPTHAHHWKEYSRNELHRYFQSLSPDFVISKSKYTHWQPVASSLRRTLADAAYRILPAFRPNLHMEIDLPRKAHGIRIEPRW